MSMPQEFWHLCERLSVVEAALLLAGVEPHGLSRGVENLASDDQPPGYWPARQAILGALRKGSIEGHVGDVGSTEYNLYTSYVDVDSLKAWLTSKGVRGGFFFPEERDTRAYLDPAHEHYAPKLTAAVRAWEAVTRSFTAGTSPKQQIERWVREHASEFGLTNDEGNPIEAAVSDIAKVANWNMKGGAPKTPTGSADDSE